MGRNWLAFGDMLAGKGRGKEDKKEISLPMIPEDLAYLEHQSQRMSFGRGRSCGRRELPGEEVDDACRDQVERGARNNRAMEASGTTEAQRDGGSAGAEVEEPGGKG